MRMKDSIITHRFDSQHIKWSNSYSMGMKLLDDQHKGLLDFINDIYSHATGNEQEERDYFQEVIHHAVQYVKTHFSTEERYMLATRFPGYAAHKTAHNEFVLTIVQTAKDFEARKRLVLEKLANFLREWVLSHIAVMDTQYARYFREIATRKADGKLSITPADIAAAR